MINFSVNTSDFSYIVQLPAYVVLFTEKGLVPKSAKNDYWVWQRIIDTIGKKLHLNGKTIIIFDEIYRFNRDCEPISQEQCIYDCPTAFTAVKLSTYDYNGDCDNFVLPLTELQQISGLPDVFVYNPTESSVHSSGCDTVEHDYLISEANI